jgi:predicted cupin superfamily sugar epimerase
MEVNVDRCRGKVFVRMEKLEIVILLTEFEFSKWHRHSIQNVFSLE